MNKGTEISWQLKFMLYLLNISLEGNSDISFDDIDGLCDETGISEFVSLVIKQRLIVPVYEAIHRCISQGADNVVLSSLKEDLAKDYYIELMNATEQDEQIEDVINALNEAGIGSIPLKGWVMRDIYPSRVMRSMADFDILAREFDEELITGAMNGIGYELEAHTGGKHEHYIGRGGLTVEVHRRLTERDDYVNEWETKVWKRAELMEGRHSIYSMSPEDMYIFHLLHMEYDITHGALPLRAICDIHRFLVAFKDMDTRYIEGELRRLEIFDFANQMEKLTDVCFKGAEMDEDTALLLDFYMSENMLGTPKRNALSRAALNSEKNPAVGLFKSRLRSLFAPMSFMKEQFPALEKYPFLLPLYRVKRLILMTKRYRADRFRRNYDKLSEEELQEMQEVLKAAGIKENHF